MSRIVLEPTATAHWRSLVLEAEQACACQLSDDLESYLVFTLMRFSGKPEMANAVLALEYLEGMMTSGRQREDSLREVGDRCLLFSGFFPKRANRRRVKISYFVDLGRSAYGQLYQHASRTRSEIYRDLASSFVGLMDILQVIRAMGSDNPVLSPLEATELWQDTGSEQALKTVKNVSNEQGLIVKDAGNTRH